MNHSTPQWRKSSHSGQEGTACIEVAAVWRKSSHSGEEGSSECIEVAALSPEIGLRDSKDPDGPHLHVTRAAFATLLTHIKASTQPH